MILAVVALMALTGGAGAGALQVSPELLAKATEHGRVRVIVQLRIAPGPEEGRTRAIERAQDSVLRALAPAPHRLLRRYETLPLLAVEVSPEALRLLAASPDVAGIEEDRLAAPQPGAAAPPRP